MIIHHIKEFDAYDNLPLEFFIAFLSIIAYTGVIGWKQQNWVAPGLKKLMKLSGKL